jgi:hypothetical protein
MARRAAPSWWYPALIAIVIGGAVLRVSAATAGLYGDELFTFSMADHGSLHGLYADFRHYEANPPGLYFLTWLLHRVWSAPEVVRVIPLASGIALIPVLAATGRRWFGASAGLAAAAVAAVSPFCIFYGSEGRGYGPAMLAVACATYSALRGVEAPAQRRWWAAFAASALLGAFVHYTVIFPLALIAAWVLLLHPPARRSILVAIAAAAALFAPWVPFMRPDPLLLKFLFLEHRTPADAVLFSARTVLGSQSSGLGSVPGTASSLLVAGVLAATGAWGLSRARGRLARPSRRALRAPWVLLVGTAIVTPVGIGLYRTVGADLFNPRNLAVSAPALIVLVGAVLTRPPGRWAAVGPALVVLALTHSASRFAFGDLRRPPTDHAAAALDAAARPQDPVIDVPAFDQSRPLRRALPIYLHRPHRLVTGNSAGRRPWEEGLRTGRVYVAQAPRPTDFPLEFLPPTDAECADPRFRLAETLFAERGFHVREYVPRTGHDLLAGQIRASRGLRDCPR